MAFKRSGVRSSPGPPKAKQSKLKNVWFADLKAIGTGDKGSG